MNKGSLRAVLTLIVACTLPLAAQDKGYWRAASSNANDITGDVSLSASKLTINFTSFIVAEIRKLQISEATALFEADPGSGGSGNLYRLNVPGAKRFLHKNTLCGSDDTQWLVTYVEGRTMHVAFFSGENMPVITSEALANSTDLCGTFSYSR
jgi:hypothetical protein